MEKFCKFKCVISRGYLINYMISKSMDVSRMCRETQNKHWPFFTLLFLRLHLKSKILLLLFMCKHLIFLYISESGWAIPDGVVAVTYKTKPWGTPPQAIHIMIMPHTYFIDYLVFPTSMWWLKKISASCVYLCPFSFILLPVNLSDTFSETDIIFPWSWCNTYFPFPWMIWEKYLTVRSFTFSYLITKVMESIFRAPSVSVSLSIGLSLLLQLLKPSVSIKPDNLEVTQSSGMIH